MEYSLNTLCHFLPALKTYPLPKLANTLTNIGLEVEGAHPYTDPETQSVDTRLDIFITPNRYDVLHHWGLAREIKAALLGAGYPISLEDPLTSNSFKPKFLPNHAILTDLGDLTFITDTDTTGFYIYLKNVTITPSLPFITEILNSLSIKTLNSIVDLTNFITRVYGQPSHAYDMDSVLKNLNPQKPQLFITKQKKALSFQALNGKSYTPSPEDLIISSNDKILGLLGIIGEETTKVTAQTKNILLEFLLPLPHEIRKTSRRHGLHTDASVFFEKHVEKQDRLSTALLLTDLLKQTLDKYKKETFIWGGIAPLLHKDTSKVLDTALSSFLKESPAYQRKIPLTLNHIPSILGDKNYTQKDFAKDILTLENLSFKCEQTPDGYDIWVPYWREKDIQSTPDLCEEILRMKGVDSIVSTPLPAYIPMPSPAPHLALQKQLMTHAVSLGYFEIVSSMPFCGEDELSSLKWQGDLENTGVKLLNPIRKQQPYMRITGLLDLMRTAQYQSSLGSSSGQIFICARSCFETTHQTPFFFDFPQAHHEYKETLNLTALVYGPKDAKNWDNISPIPWRISHIISHVKAILAAQDLTDIHIKNFEKENPFFQTFSLGATLHIGSSESPEIGWVGILNHDIYENFKIIGPVMVFELNVLGVLNKKKETEQKIISFKPFEFLPIERDLSLYFDKHYSAGEVIKGCEVAFLAAILDYNQENNDSKPDVELKNVSLFDIFKKDQTFYGIRWKFISKKSSLVDRQIQYLMDKTLFYIEKNMGGKLR